MSQNRTRRYWDANVFVALIKGEEGRADVVEVVLEAAQRGETEIYTSALTLVEVVKRPDGEAPVSEQDEDTIRAYFQHEFIVIVPFTADMGEGARELHWHRGLRWRDAVHVATAIRARADVLETYDNQLLAISEQVGDPPLLIAEPAWEGNVPMDL
jgi:predicted nucleic acid-binding protein